MNTILDKDFWDSQVKQRDDMLNDYKERCMMPKYRIHGTLFTFMDAIVEAKDEDEAIAMYSASTSNLDWFEVGSDWEFLNEYATLDEENDDDE